MVTRAATLSMWRPELASPPWPGPARTTAWNPDYVTLLLLTVVFRQLPTFVASSVGASEMNVTRSLAIAATFAAVAVGAAAPSSAAPVMSGHYIKTETNPASGQTATDDWYFTPCGDGCASVTVGGPTPGPLGQARLVNGQWTIDINGTAGCQDGSRLPNAESDRYTWDPNTLAGTVQVTDKVAVCGNAAPVSFTNNVQLRQAPASDPKQGSKGQAP
jgi:hypothetical protein